MKLKLGKTYLTRNNLLMDITDVDASDIDYPYRAICKESGDYHFYTVEGNFWSCKDKSDMDLVKEVKSMKKDTAKIRPKKTNTVNKNIKRPKKKVNTAKTLTTLMSVMVNVHRRLVHMENYLANPLLYDGPDASDIEELFDGYDR